MLPDPLLILLGPRPLLAPLEPPWPPPRSPASLAVITFNAVSVPLGIAVSFIVGFASSLLGIGGGIIHVPFLITFLGFPTTSQPRPRTSSWRSWRGSARSPTWWTATWSAWSGKR